jgi:hypothetical protein
MYPTHTDMAPTTPLPIHPVTAVAALVIHLLPAPSAKPADDFCQIDHVLHAQNGRLS